MKSILYSSRREKYILEEKELLDIFVTYCVSANFAIRNEYKKCGTKFAQLRLNQSSISQTSTIFQVYKELGQKYYEIEVSKLNKS